MKRILLGSMLSVLAFSLAASTASEDPASNARIVTMNSKPAQCLSAVQIWRVDGERVYVHRNGFDIEAGRHSLNGRAFLDTSYCRPLHGRVSQEVPDLEVEFEAGKTYYIGFDHSSRNVNDWRLVVWKVEPEEG